jgi:hypothetical protein
LRAIEGKRNGEKRGGNLESCGMDVVGKCEREKENEKEREGEGERILTH